jgi:hypothetical protein
MISYKNIFLLSAAMMASSLLFGQAPGLAWAIQIAGSSTSGNNGGEGHAIITDASGNVYSTGYFNGTVDFDPGTSILNLTASVQDIYIQ